MPKVLVSACLTGRRCRHDGGERRQEPLLRALENEGVETVPVCPEEAGGLGTPRPPAHLEGGDGEAVVAGTGRVLRADGTDVTESFLAGARRAVDVATREGCEVAYLKERSPSCGTALVHGRGGVERGCGVTAAMLRLSGIATISVD